MSAGSDAITKIYLLSAKENLRSNSAKLLSCTQRGHDADMYESSWRSKGKRYLCFEKDPNSSYVITDLLIVRDDDPVPNNFTGIFLTRDTDEKALKKHILCVKSEQRATASKVVSDLILINQSKGEKADPHYFTISHEVNEMNVTFRIDNVSRPTQAMPHSQSEPRLSEVPLHTAKRAGSLGPHIAARRAPLLRSLSIARVTGIDGVPFTLNPKLNMDVIANDPIISSIQIVTVDDVNRKYTYNFSIEEEAVKKGD